MQGSKNFHFTKYFKKKFLDPSLKIIQKLSQNHFDNNSAQNLLEEYTLNYPLINNLYLSPTDIKQKQRILISIMYDAINSTLYYL